MRPQPVSNPPNPWASTALEYLEEVPRAELQVFLDSSRQVIARNDSPDLGFEFSVNPYRGCQHACAYCYARPGHEYLSWGAGSDFDTKVLVKRDAARLLREAFERPSWKGDLLMFSGVTDCYQPLEASLRLTRACLEVCADYRNPVAITTKAPLVERDLDVLTRLARDADVRVSVSIPIHDPVLARAIEPGVATPKRRLQAIRALAQAGVPVGVLVAPLIPGLSEDAMVETLEAAREAGARWAGYVLLRLPGAVKHVFEERLRAALPLRADKVLGRVRQTRGGALYDARFGVRGVGTGVYAQAVSAAFGSAVARLGYEASAPPVRRTFQRPRERAQLGLFG